MHIPFLHNLSNSTKMNTIKKWTGILLLIGFIMPLEAQTQTLNQESTDKSGKTILLGQCNRDGLTKTPYNDWFSKNYENYKPNETLIKKSKRKIKGIEVEIFMGTWCGDSKREVPRFYKVIEELNIDEANIALINVNNTDKQYKQSPTNEEKGKLIHRVPTFIFYKDGEEMGRIVETPVTSFEMDIAQLLNGLPVEPNYKVVHELDKVLNAEGVPSDRKGLFEIAKKIQYFDKNDRELNTYGYILMNQGEIDKAIAVLTINSMLYSKTPNVYDSLGEAYEQKGDLDQALLMYQKVLSITPKNKHALEKVEELTAEAEG